MREGRTQETPEEGPGTGKKPRKGPEERKLPGRTTRKKENYPEEIGKTRTLFFLHCINLYRILKPSEASSCICKSNFVI